MKKIISLLLVICFICLVLSGCNMGEIVRTVTFWKLPNGVIETTTLDKEGSSINIAHSDNFTQDDIEFVSTLHGKTVGKNNYTVETVYDSVGRLLWQIIEKGRSPVLTHYENPYIICAYLKPYQMEYLKEDKKEYEFDVERYVWYKFYDPEGISDAIEKMDLTDFSYLMYDCTIKRDILTGVEYNKQCKYYLRYYDKYNLKYDSVDMLVESVYDTKFTLESNINNFKSNIYIDKDGTEYLIAYKETYEVEEDGTLTWIMDNSEEELQEYYDMLSPYFERIEGTDYAYNFDGYDLVEKYIYVSLDNLFEILSTIKGM